MPSIGQALIAQAQPFMFERMALERIQAEGAKGCCPDTPSQPVALEPSYHALHKQRDLVSQEEAVDGWTQEPVPQERSIGQRPSGHES